METSIGLSRLAYSVYNKCMNLNNSFIRYKNHSKYLCEVAKSVEKYYEVLNNDEPPEVIMKLFNYIKKFEYEVEKLQKKNTIKRLWSLSRNNEKLDHLRDELDFIMKEFTIQNFLIANTGNNNYKEMSEMLQKELKNLKNQNLKEKDNEKIENENQEFIINKLNNTPIKADTIHIIQYSYEPRLDDEIQLNVGDSVKIIKVYDDGWCYGKNLNSGEVGHFPINYITGNDDSSMMDDEIENENQISQEVIINELNNTPIEADTIHIIQYSYEPELDDEIQLNVGDSVKIIEVDDDGWCYGKNLNSGEVGHFPINYITGNDDSSMMDDEIENENQISQEVIINELNYTPIEAGNIQIIQYSYEPELDDEIQLNVGDSVNINIYNDGWCYGNNLNSDNAGHFTINYFNGNNNLF